MSCARLRRRSIRWSRQAATSESGVKPPQSKTPRQAGAGQSGASAPHSKCALDRCLRFNAVRANNAGLWIDSRIGIFLTGGVA